MPEVACVRAEFDSKSGDSLLRMHSAPFQTIGHVGLINAAPTTFQADMNVLNAPKMQ